MAKTLPLLPQNYTHLTLLKSALSRDKRGGRPRALQCEHTAIYKLAKKPYFLIYCSLSRTVCLSSIILLNALTIRVCPERPHTLVSQL